MIRWAVMDEERVKKYVNRLELTWWQKRGSFLRLYFTIIAPLSMLISTIIYSLSCFLFITINFPEIPFMNYWGADFFNSWGKATYFHEKWALLMPNEISIIGIITCIGVGLVLGIFSKYDVETFFMSLTFTSMLLLFIVIFNSPWGSWESLEGQMIPSVGFSFFIGIFFGFLNHSYGFSTKYLVHNFLGLLTLVISISTFISVVVQQPILLPLNYGLAFALGVSIIYMFSYAVLILMFSKNRINLHKNPYIIWRKFDTPLFIEGKLISETTIHPATGLRLADFLWQYRPRQHNIAALLAHVATAKIWENAAIVLNESQLTFPEYDQEGFQVPTRWQEQLAEAKKSLIAAESTHLIGTRVTLFQDFLAALEALYKSTQQVPEKTWRDKISMTRRINWYRYYEAAVAAWLTVGREKYAELQALAALTEPIATNRYQTGGALSPAYNQAVFMEREDLREQLSAQLYTTQNFSVFFLQGQRRVGKTSLLKFLPDILGRRFELVYLDLQGSIRSVPDFLEKWQRAFVAHFGLEDVPPLPTADTWAASFEAMHPLFSKTAQVRDVKIILALDEYEELHTHLAKDPEQGAALLGAIRHFSQHQAQVSLMFVGLRFFSELQAPNWNEYFPQSVPIQVGYLNREKTFQLLEVSTLDFEDGIKERIYDLTQGHPSLIQKIAYELVQIANREGRRHLTHTDLDTALRTMIYIHDNGVTDIFWSQNCELPIDKEIVRAIVEGKPLPPQSRQRLRRLIEYGFVVEEGEGHRMRVPIFEEWVRRFGLE